MMSRLSPMRLVGLVLMSAVNGTTLVPSVHAEEKMKELLNLRAVPFTQVEINDAFWAPRRETNRKVSLAHSLDMLEKAGNMRDFELAAQKARTGYAGPVFMDSDLYKTLEAVSYSLATDPDAALEKRVDDIIAKIAGAQLPDGYLNTWYQVNAPDKRFTNLRDHHELYCAGHLFEAAVAHFEATGKRTLLNIATKYADHIDSIFGDGAGKRLGYCGHPEVELALVKLSRATGERRYFELAKYFIKNRGSKFFATEHNTPLDKYDGSYWQDDVPICDHRSIEGHAVRAGYLFSACVDVGSQTGDSDLMRMIDRVWNNTTTKRMYVTGGVGPSAQNEGFTTDYDLPNLTAYQETCASVAMAMWNHRLNLACGSSKYADLVELALYNGILAGVSLDGRKFFYVNPLTSNGNHHRSEWFGCACCPPNVARTLSSLGEYAYATSDDGLWVNLFIQGAMKATIAGKPIAMQIATEYPWGGAVKLTLNPAAETRFSLHLRIPAWCEATTVRIGGKPVESPARAGGYMVLERAWKAGDVVDLDLAMPVRRIAANPLVADDVGKLAIARGPLIYCLEGCDHKTDLSTIAVPAEAELTASKEEGLPAMSGGANTGASAGGLRIPGGVVVLKGRGTAATERRWTGELYKRAVIQSSVPVTAIPYCLWDHRAAGEMLVWAPTSPPAPKVVGPEADASVSLSFTSGNCQPAGINDGIEPKSSDEQAAATCHWWPHKGTAEWAQYTWAKPIRVDCVRVYWFDDTGRGECRLPASWRLLYQDGSDWKPVSPLPAQSKSQARGFEVAKDRWCEVRFAPVNTAALRLDVQLQPGWAAGVHEWKVCDPEGDGG